jgi:hypothetical protein
LIREKVGAMAALGYVLDVYYVNTQTRHVLVEIHAPEMFSVKSTYFDMMSVYYTFFNNCISELKYHIRLGSSYGTCAEGSS